MPAALSHQGQASPGNPMPDMNLAYGTHCSTPSASSVSGGGGGGGIQADSSSLKASCVGGGGVFTRVARPAVSVCARAGAAVSARAHTTAHMMTIAADLPTRMNSPMNL